MPSDADEEAIKKAYRKLARKYHPDVSTSPDSEARFKEAAQAYATLKDPARRAAYDQLERRGPGEEFAPPPQWRQAYASTEHAFDDIDLSDLLAGLAGRRGAAPAGCPRMAATTRPLPESTRRMPTAEPRSSLTWRTKTAHAHWPSRFRRALSKDRNCGCAARGKPVNLQTHESLWLDGRHTVDVPELSRICGLSTDELLELIDYGALAPLRTQQQQPVFSTSCIMPLRQAAGIRNDFDLDLFTIVILLGYINRINELERQLGSLRSQLPSQAHV